MRVAFYSPMKPPDHPNPSGDRLMARNLIDALTSMGHQVTVASRLRTRDPIGSPERQQRLQRIGAWSAERILRRVAAHPPDVWLTYHLYYKAVDWIGPIVSQRLGIPYAVAEASYAPKRAAGPWSRSHEAVENALGQARLFIYPNPVDLECAKPLLPKDAETFRLPPFIKLPHKGARPSKQALAAAYGLDPARPWILTVGMMRHGDKESSYGIAADVLSRLPSQDYCHIAVGDGDARSKIEATFSGLPTTFVGRKEGDDLEALYAAADLFLWPAVNEAWGMVFLEAQAHGLPVIAGRAGGVEHVLVDGVTGWLCDLEEPATFVEALTNVLQNTQNQSDMGNAARDYVAENHSFETVAAALSRALRRVTS